MDKNKVKGMLWGLIVGDAFGSPIQFSTKDGHKWLSEMEDCPVFNLPKDIGLMTAPWHYV